MPHSPTALIAVVIAVLAAGTAAAQDVNKAAPTVKDVMTTMTVSASEATFRVIDAKDADALSEAGDSVYLTCETCHARYMGK